MANQGKPRAKVEEVIDGDRLRELFRGAQDDRREEPLKEMMGRMESTQKEYQVRIRELEKRQAEIAQGTELLKYVSRLALPTLSAAVIALFCWVWNSHTALAVAERAHLAVALGVDELQEGTKSRYTSEQAKEDFKVVKADFRVVEAKIQKLEDTLRAEIGLQVGEVSKRVEGVDDDMHELLAKLE